MSIQNHPDKKGDVVSIGETMLYFQAEDYGLLRYSHRFDKFIGGTESNTMISLAKLGFSTGWISRLGADEFGYNIRDFIRGHGVDVSRIVFDSEAPTGIFFVEKNANDEVRSFYYRKGSAASRMQSDDLDMDYICGHKMLHLTGITPLLSENCRQMTRSLINAAKREGMTVSFDPNLRLTMADIETYRKILHPLMAMIDIFLPSEKELLLLMDTQDLDTAIARAKDMGLGHIVIKKGDRGCLLIKNDTRHQEPVFPVKKVVSSMAAGDAFNAGYLAGVLKGFDDIKTLRIAGCVGAMATLAWGPYEGIPEWETVMAYVEGIGVVER
jgi:2-dehydro-3-deoxygluconokinase